jgi:FAD/FMN-containing dehydrogenase
LVKVAELHESYRQPLMVAVKLALDPAGLLNPGKVLS